MQLLTVETSQVNDGPLHNNLNMARGNVQKLITQTTRANLIFRQNMFQWTEESWTMR